MDSPFWFIVVSLAVWRLTSILYQEEIAHSLRKWAGGQLDEPSHTWSYPETFRGKLFSCFWCLSIWVAAGCVVVWWLQPEILLPFAASAVAIKIQEKG